MQFLHHLNAALYPSLALAAWSLIILVPAWATGGTSHTFWDSAGVYLLPLLPLGGFGGGFVAAQLLRPSAGRAPARIPVRSGSLVGFLTGLMSMVLGAAIMVVVHVVEPMPGLEPSAASAKPVFAWVWWFLIGYGTSYVIPAIGGGAVGAWWARKRSGD